MVEVRVRVVVKICLVVGVGSEKMIELELECRPTLVFFVTSSISENTYLGVVRKWLGRG